MKDDKKLIDELTCTLNAVTKALEQEKKKYSDALERARKIINGENNWGYCDMTEIKPAIEEIFSELAESEDERIRKMILDQMLRWKEMACKEGVEQDIKDSSKAIAWLEKQKEQKPSIFPPGLGEAHWNPIPSEKDIHKWNLPEDFEEAVYKVANFISPFDSQEELRKVSHRFAEQLMSLAKKELVQKPAEKSEKPNIELIQRSWYMEGYHDGKYKREPKWIIKAQEDGPKHELNPRYGEPLAEEQGPVEWNEEDEKKLDALIQFINEHIQNLHENYKCLYGLSLYQLRSFLKSLRPQKKSEWSEEDKEALDMCFDVIPKRWKTQSGMLLTEWLKEHIQPQTDTTYGEYMAYGKRQYERGLKEGVESVKPVEWSEDFGEEVERVSKRYPEVSFAKLSRIAKHFAEWANKYSLVEWSEDDIRVIKTAIVFLKDFADLGYENAVECIDWLNNLLNHTFPKQEWSEEEIGHLFTLASYIKSNGYEDDGEFLEGVANKLKSLRPHKLSDSIPN